METVIESVIVKQKVLFVYSDKVGVYTLGSSFGA